MGRPRKRDPDGRPYQVSVDLETDQELKAALLAYLAQYREMKGPAVMRDALRQFLAAAGYYHDPSVPRVHSQQPASPGAVTTVRVPGPVKVRK